jgi:plastocyanin
MKTTHTRTAAALSALFLLAGLTAASAGAATVRTRGGADFIPNEYVRDTLHFSPGRITVRPNGRVTWIDADRAPDPHTVTVVRRREVPNTLNELFECRVCQLAGAHLVDPNDPNSGVARVRVNVGVPGLNIRGDSLFLAPGGRISARVTARLGTTLYYICAIHPWMQGSIHVGRAARRTGAALTGRHTH